ncbi:chlorite dismutase [Phreatobacter aquaticus]|uniref:Chlorite dismutase n=1 Tax=Phreatobacter aquaticus TaxID=2570229 RepID=A0A4D7QB59_9HYPH|nr:chlorite dismutase family protein [Phreatobacter aquaticus]QCK84418.1 chlorite dismutase [Phreatobacter aquaticus]
MPPPLHVTFAAGSAGAWRIDRIDAVRGEPLPVAERLAVIEAASAAEMSTWTLRGVVSNTRYTNRDEVSDLTTRQEGLGRPASTRAALIPISKSEAWWALAQDERRAIMEERSHHIAIGLDYLPAIARRLHHSRDLGERFDFLTWFEFAPEHEGDFNKLVARLRQTEEWRYVTREVDIRLTMAAGGPAS